jgi:mono/diheme cytochrome c family protein
VTLGRPVVLALLALGFAAGCSQGEKLSPEAERGRQVYQAQCIACHNTNPAQPGALGPQVKGSSEALLRAKVLHAISRRSRPTCADAARARAATSRASVKRSRAPSR